MNLENNRRHSTAQRQGGCVSAMCGASNGCGKPTSRATGPHQSMLMRPCFLTSLASRMALLWIPDKDATTRVRCWPVSCGHSTRERAEWREGGRDAKWLSAATAENHVASGGTIVGHLHTLQLAAQPRELSCVPVACLLNLGDLWPDGARGLPCLLLRHRSFTQLARQLLAVVLVLFLQ